MGYKFMLNIMIWIDRVSLRLIQIAGLKTAIIAPQKTPRPTLLTPAIKVPTPLFIILVLGTLSSCIPAGTNSMQPTTVTIASQSSAAGELPAANQTGSAHLPAPALFTNAWEDRSVYRAGLVEEAQDSLQKLAGAPIYHLDITIDENLQHLSGRQEILFTNTEKFPLDRIYLHLYPNLFGGKLEVANLVVNDLPVETTTEVQDTALRVSLVPPLEPGESVIIRLDFAVDVPTEANSNYNTFAYTGNVLALAQFYPLLAVHNPVQGWSIGIPPIYGDVLYADAGFYQVRIDAPRDLVLVTSGVVTAKESSGNRQKLTIVAGPVREFYVAGSREYTCLSQKIGQVTVNSYAPAGLQEGAQMALETAINALQSFDRRLGAYPYTEYDLAATATSALGVEYPGMTAISDQIYNLEGSMAGIPTSIYLESTVAHEAGHQWFYNEVGNDQVNEPWLDEALTQYITGLYFQDRYGAEAAEQYRQNWQQRWARVERKNIPIGLPVKDYPGQEYSAIIYGRGPIFLQEMAGSMGNENFNAFLLRYVETYRWKIATGKDFKQLAEQQCGCNLTSLFTEWVYP